MDTNLNPPQSAVNMPPENTSVVMGPSANASDLNSVVNVSQGNSSGSKKLWVGLGIFVALITVGVATYVVQRQSFTQSRAQDCTLYSFDVSDSGVVTVFNDTGNTQAEQQAMVYINDVLVETFDVPEIGEGEIANLGVVTVPPIEEGFTWSVAGTIECSNSGSHEAEDDDGFQTPTPTGEVTPTITNEVTPTVTSATTPSITPTPNPSESPTPGPSNTPTNGPTNTPTPTGTAQGTGDELAAAGFSTPTFLAFGMGIFLVMGALLLAL